VGENLGEGPALDAGTVRDDDAASVWHHLTRHGSRPPAIMAKGEGLRLWDLDGREYLDAASGGVWCVNLGYGRRELAEAVYDQLLRLPYYVASAGNPPAAKFARRLTRHTPGLTRVYYSNSGSEANEKAIKMLRLKSFVQGRPERIVVLYRDRDYHGTTYGTLSCSGQPERTAGFGPLSPGFESVPHALCYRCAFGLSYPACDLECARAIEAKILETGPDKVAGAIFETVTAGGGIIVPVPEYYRLVAETVRKYSLGLIMDEVVCGLGRTGSMFAYQGYGLSPELVTMAKGLASAYMPISATVATEELFAALQAGPGDLGYFRDISTFGGSAAAAAAALENLDIIEREDLLANVRRMGDLLLEGLRENLEHPNVGDVRGLGLLAGVEFVADKASRTPLAEDKVVAVVAAMAAKGVLVGRTNRSLPGLNTVVNLAPAYVVTKDDLEVILRVFREAVREVLGPGR
jgi:taurine-pyruvate aminotransferase